MDLNLTEEQIDEILLRINNAKVILVDSSRIGDVDLRGVEITDECLVNVLED